MALNFPASPTLNQVFTSGTRSWLWDGSSWVANNSVTNILGYIPVNKAGDTMSGGLNVPNVNAVTVTANSSGFSIAGGSSSSKTLTVSNGVTIAGTDGSTLNIGAGGTLLSGAFQASSQGTTGAQGVQGTTGSQGAQGTDGVQGNTGAQGTQGLTGPNGIQGATGTQGSTGTQGATGVQGSTGAQGIQGITGSQGATGTQGAVGSTGGTGATGSTGVQGSTGAQGTSGASILGTNNTWSGTNAFTYPSGTAIISLDSTASLGTGTGLSLAWRSYSNSGNSILATTAAMRGARENSTSGNYAGLFSIYTTDSGGSNLERFHINSSGNVGIGTTSPSSLLHINNGEIKIQNTDYGRVMFVRGSTNIWAVGPRNTDDLYIRREGGSANVVFDGGNVGIGVTAPTASLQVASSSALAAGNPSIILQGSNNTERISIRSTSASVFVAQFANGTLASPTAVTTGNFLGSYQFGGYAATLWTRGAQVSGSAAGTWTDTSTPANIVFETVPSGSTGFLERMRIDSSGNVGIGTTSPLAKLNVIGDIKIGDGSNSRGLNLLQNYMSLGETENSATTILGNNIKATDGVNGTVQVSTSANDGSVWVALNYSNGITFNRIAAAAIGTQYSENAGELMRITTAGNVGIGTTSPASKLHIAGDANTRLQIDATTTQGIFFTKAGADNGTFRVDTNGNFEFFTKTVNQAMVLTAAGNVGIGTTSPTYKLSISANTVTGGIFVQDTDSANASPVIRVQGNRVDNNGSQSFSGGLVLERYNSNGSSGLVSDNVLGTIYFGGNYNTTPTFTYPASISAIAEANWTSTSAASTGLVFFTGATGQSLGTANVAFGTERARITSGGNLLVGTTSSFSTWRMTVESSASDSIGAVVSNTSAYPFVSWNKATSGDNIFAGFFTEATITYRGAISYNRGAGLVAYQTTSDYRAKDIIGPVIDSGALIDSVPVYIGKMKGATLERPMFIAHETPAYAHTGEKDAVDAEGKPIYQQMDASTLVPVLWAELQSVRARLAALENK